MFKAWKYLLIWMGMLIASIFIGVYFVDKALLPYDVNVKGEVTNEPTFGAGYSPVTGFQTQTTSRISASDTTIPVASVTDKAGNTISPSSISSSSTVRMYFNLEPGTTREEPIYCTGISSLNLTGCVRGIAFQGADLTSSSTIAQAHNAGSKIIMTNLGVMYGNEFVAISGDQTIFDTKTFNTFPRATSTTAVPTNNAEFVTKYYSDTQIAAGFSCSSASSTLGITCSGAPAVFGINPSSTAGLAFDSAGKLYVNTSSTSLAFDTSGSLKVDQTQNFSWSGTQAFNATTTFAATNTFTGEVYVPTSTSDGQAVNAGYLKSRFYGDASDGALDIQSGTTTLNTASKNVYQYSSVTIGGTGVLTFGSNLQNKPIIIYVKGDLTVTSTAPVGAVNASGLGATTTNDSLVMDTGLYYGGDAGNGSGGGGGGGGGGGAGGANAAGTIGSVGAGGGSGGTAGVAGLSYFTPSNANVPINLILARPYMGKAGGAGGRGWTGAQFTCTAAVSGAGGGTVIFIVGGNINITSTFISKGNNGSNGASPSPGDAGCGGAGGGSGGYIGVYYGGNVTANSAVFTVTAGSGGTATNGLSFNGGNGGAGAAGRYDVKKINNVSWLY